MATDTQIVLVALVAFLMGAGVTAMAAAVMIRRKLNGD